MGVDVGRPLRVDFLQHLLLVYKCLFVFVAIESPLKLPDGPQLFQGASPALLLADLYKGLLL